MLRGRSQATLTRFWLFLTTYPPALTFSMVPSTLESGIDVGQEINVGPGKFGKKNKRRALNKRRA